MQSRARNMVLLSLCHGEQTEAFLFADAEQRKVPAHELNAAIAALVADGRVVETVISSPAWPWGCGDVDALRLAA